MPLEKNGLQQANSLIAWILGQGGRCSLVASLVSAVSCWSFTLLQKMPYLCKERADDSSQKAQATSWLQKERLDTRRRASHRSATTDGQSGQQLQQSPKPLSAPSSCRSPVHHTAAEVSSHRSLSIDNPCRSGLLPRIVVVASTERLAYVRSQLQTSNKTAVKVLKSKLQGSIYSGCIDDRRLTGYRYVSSTAASIAHCAMPG